MTERAMKIGKSPGAHGVPTQHVRGDVMKMSVAICRRIWKTKTWSEQWANSLMISQQKKGNIRLCHNYRTITLISHPNKMLLRFMLNRIKGKAVRRIGRI